MSRHRRVVIVGSGTDKTTAGVYGAPQPPARASHTFGALIARDSKAHHRLSLGARFWSSTFFITAANSEYSLFKHSTSLWHIVKIA